MSLARVCLAATAASLVAGTSVARADRIERAAVIAIEAREIYISVGAASGLAAGDRLRIKRPLRLRHPVSREMVDDWLPIGAADVTAVGDRMAMAVVDAALIDAVQVGDLAEAYVVGAEPVPGTAPEPALPGPEAPLPEVDAETAEVLAVWRDTAGRSLEARIGAWQAYLDRAGDSRFAAVIREDLELLRAQRDALQPPELSLEQRSIGGLSHAAPTRTRRAAPLALVFVLDSPADFAAAWLHYRPHGAATYQKAMLRREGARYLRGAVPAEVVRAPGVEYFVELATDRGGVGSAAGSPDAPIAVEVAPEPLSEAFASRPRQSRVSLTTTYLDFATFDRREGNRTDRFVTFEADFLYRLRRALWGIRAGFGVINGEGGFADQVHPPGMAPTVAFHYGYVEGELRGPRATALLVRGIAGVGREGLGLGLEGRVRLGAEDGTNLSLGASRLDEIGFLTEMRMQWLAMPRAPLGLAVALTDRPARGDLGVRLTTDIGWRVLDWLQPTIRVSYQARTVTHAGVGAGLGLVFDW